MKPRYEPRNEEYDNLLKEAKALEERVNAKIEKTVPDYSGQKEGSMEGPSRFETQPGKVPNVFYNTNNVVPEIEDVKNAGTTSEKSNILDKPTQFPDVYDSQIKYRLNEKGGEGPVLKSLGGSEEKINLQDIRKSTQRLDRHFN